MTSKAKRAQYTLGRGDVDAADEPVKQLDACRHHRRLAVGPDETVAGFEPL